jgi:acetoin:2,6-dichlorophenolindophenol oxidoreductase subunit beta
VIYARALGAALERALETDERVVVLGEDIADPYGGAFKVTRGLTTRFPERVRTTPISEAAIAGVSAGLALEGYRPIAEIMFGDFITLAFDQIVNHIAKYGAMYDGSVTCPVIIRTPFGGGRAYGPTHSQSLEKHLFGIPHLQVVAGSLLHDPHEVLTHLLGADAPTIHVEHKLLYPLHMGEPRNGMLGDLTCSHVQSDGYLPTAVLRPVPREDCTLTVLAYGYQAELARRVIERLAVEEEMFAELLVPAQISPLDWDVVTDSVAVTGSLLTIEEGTAGWSWGTEIAATIGKRLFGRLRRPVEVLASAADVIPSAREREADTLVGEYAIERAIREAAG